MRTNLITSALAVLLTSAPAWTHSGIISINETTLSAVTGSPCYTQQPDLSVGKVVYYKGQATLNGAEPELGSYVHNGDILTTSHDGFVAIELDNGKLASVQPITHLSVTCSDMPVQVHHTMQFSTVGPRLSEVFKG